MRKVGPCHLHPIVDCPKRSAERIRNSSKATTRSSIRLEHDQWKVGSLRNHPRVVVYPNKIGDFVMGKIIGERCLWIYDSGTGVELGSAIVGGIALVD